MINLNTYSSPNRATQARKSPSRVTLGDPEARIFRRIIRENEFTSQENIFTPHECGSDCSSNASLSSSLHPINILSIPIFLGMSNHSSGYNKRLIIVPVVVIGKV